MALIAEATCSAAHGNQAKDWAAVLRNDAQAFHDLVQENHPGPANTLDPGFSARNDRGLARARNRASKVHDYAGYYWAMREYAASFDDGHVAYVPAQSAPAIPSRWAGIMTGYDGRGRQVIRVSADAARVPLGAELISCDGITAEKLALRNLAPFRGRWFLAADRLSAAPMLLVDSGNPFISQPSRCRFSMNGRPIDTSLEWRAISSKELADYRKTAAASSTDQEIGVRELTDGTQWYAFPTFYGDANKATEAALSSLISDMNRDRAALAAAPRIVFDLRGNGGGSGIWAQRIAAAIWGQDVVDALPPESVGVDWRVSPANIAILEGDLGRIPTSADTLDRRGRLEQRIASMKKALASGQKLLREANDRQPIKAVAPPRRSKPVYVLTDAACASACLDAVDLWKRLGAVQVGQETNADTLYMELRDDALPSGLATVYMPMKVWRGRPRGSNVPAIPKYRFKGDMRDTAALQAWTATLPSK
ncbi:S41 family peptidase [Sphingomonas floccifaciens]